MIGFESPALLGLWVPVLWGWVRVFRGQPGGTLRALALSALVVAMAGPVQLDAEGGRDLVVVLDRSRSMAHATSEGTAASRGPRRVTDLQLPLLEALHAARGARDRLGVVVVGARAITHGPLDDGPPRDPALAEPGGGGTALYEGLQRAAALIAEGRTGRLLVHSDGDATDGDLASLAPTLRRLGVAVDVAPVPRVGLVDTAVAGVTLPDSVHVGETFLASTELVTDRAITRTLVVRRDGRVVLRREVALSPGAPTVVRFPDRLAQAGVARYESRLEGPGDRRPDDDVAHGALRVFGAGETVLVIGGDGGPGHLSRALVSAGLDVATRAAGPLTLAELVRVRAVVLDDVPAGALGHDGMVALARWVRHLGGGLIAAGGPHAFGLGAWHESPLEDVLPVTCEVRDAQRAMPVTLVAALDRSGSMSMPVAGRLTKMDLANSGTASALRMLGPLDHAAVFAVDTAAHEVLPLTAAGDPEALVGTVRGIVSQGGGIYVGEAMRAAARAALASDDPVRHVLLFADASDAVEPADAVSLAGELRAAGVTVSVIGLGTSADADAPLLERLAAAGGGRFAVTERPEELPRLFAHEAVLVSGAAWRSGPAPLAPAAALAGALGPELAGHAAWPVLSAWNVVHARPTAGVWATVQAPSEGGEGPVSPAAAAWPVGAGRAVALAFDADSPHEAALLAWPGYGSLVASSVRWALGRRGEEASGPLDAWLRAERRGGQATLALEGGPGVGEGAVPVAQLVRASADGDPGLGDDTRRVPMRPVGPGRWEAQLPIAGQAGGQGTPPVWLAVAHLADPDGSVRAVSGPAVQAPADAESEPAVPGAGSAALETLARRTGGRVLRDPRTEAASVWRGPESPGTPEPLTWLAFLLALVFAVTEIAWRRLGLPGWLTRPRRGPAATTWAKTASRPPTATAARSSAGPDRSGSGPTSPSEPPRPPAAPSARGGARSAMDAIRQRRGRE